MHEELAGAQVEQTDNHVHSQQPQLHMFVVVCVLQGSLFSVKSGPRPAGEAWYLPGSLRHSLKKSGHSSKGARGLLLGASDEQPVPDHDEQ